MDRELKKIKSRSSLSFVSLLANSSYSAFLGFLAFFILTLKSGAYLLGIYNTVLAMLSFFNYFTNLGLAAAIMQRKKIEEIDLSSAFFTQLILATAAVIIGYFLTPNLFKVYKDLPYSARYLYWSVLVSFYFLSLKTIPSVLMEKRLEIYKVVLVQAIENTAFYLSIIILVLLGYGIESIIFAVLLRAILGLIMIYIMNPWMPKPMFSFKSTVSLLKYGIPFQSNSFLALIKDDLLILYLGGAIGLTNLGYVAFGKKYAEFSIRIIMDNVNRVAFPLFAKFQASHDMLKKSLNKVFFYESLFIFPIVFGAIFIFESLLKLVPGYFQKWSVSLFSFYFFSLSSIFVSLSSPFINFFNAIGKVKLSVFYMIILTTLTWILVPALIKIFGFNGISISFFLISLTFIFVLRTAKQQINFSLSTFIRVPVLATAAMCIYLYLIRLVSIYVPSPLFNVAFSLIGGALIYYSIIYKYKKDDLYHEIAELLKLKK